MNPTGIFISAPSFTDIFASFLAGRWADKFSRVSYLLLSLTLAEVFASALYLVARDERIQRQFLLNRYFLEFYFNLKIKIIFDATEIWD